MTTTTAPPTSEAAAFYSAALPRIEALCDLARAWRDRAPADLERIQHVHDLSCELGAGCAEAKHRAVPTRRPDPTLAEIRDRLKALPPAPPSTGRYVVVTGMLHVDREVRRAAQEAADLCSDGLGIKRRDVVWFTDATPDLLIKLAPNPERFDAGDADGCAGVFRPDRSNVVYVKATDDPRLAAEVAAHETRHRWQVLTRGKPHNSELAALEADARAYSDRFAAWLDEQQGAIA